MTEDQIRRILWRCIWMSRGEAPVDADYAYWIPMWPGLVARGVEINHPNYAEDRVLGWQAGGADVARFGDYANPPTPYHAVPPYPGDVVPPVVVPPGPGPTASDVILAAFQLLEQKIDAVAAAVQAITPPAPGDWLLLEQQIAALRIDVAHLMDVGRDQAARLAQLAGKTAPVYEGTVSAPWPIGTIKITLTPKV